MKILIVYVSIFVGMTELKFIGIHITEGFPGGSDGRVCLTIQETQVQSLGWEDTLE